MTDRRGHALVSAPTAEPVSVQEARDWLRLTHSADDAKLSRAIKSATRALERRYSRQLVTATWRLTLDDFPACGVIRPERGPLRSVASIAYVDCDGVTRTLDPSAYQVDAAVDPGVVVVAYGQVWPTARPQTLGAVAVTYEAGYGAAADVPDEAKEAVLLTVAWRFANPGDVSVKDSIPGAAHDLMTGLWNGAYA